MAHVAGISENGFVREVHVLNNSDLPDNGSFTAEVEAAANVFQHALGLEGVWRLTSVTGNFRGQYASIGDRYDEATDTFISPEPAEPVTE